MDRRMSSTSPWCAVLLLYQGACMPTTSHGVRLRSTAARSRFSHAICRTMPNDQGRRMRAALF